MGVILNKQVFNGQNALDIAIANYGSTEGLQKLWEENEALNLFTEDLIGGSTIVIEQGVLVVPPSAPSRTDKPKDTRYELTVLRGQNIIDIAIQEYGSVEGLIDLITRNDLTLETVLSPGQVLKLDTKQVVGKAVNRYYKERSIKVATGLDYEADEGGPYWIDEAGNYIVTETGARIRYEV